MLTDFRVLGLIPAPLLDKCFAKQQSFQTGAFIQLYIHFQLGLHTSRTS